jgi:carboxyl-terminal processing protease
MRLEDSGLGYLKISTFSDDYNLLASSWDNYIRRLNENEVPGLIIDLRDNSGGAMDLALSFAGYFFDEEIPLYDGYYYSDESGKFESDESPAIMNPAPFQFDGPVAVLVRPYCVSACEGFAYALTQDDRSIIVGSFPTAGAFGEVGRGQYNMPDELSMQFPTGRPLSPEGEVLIEGVGVIPDVTVPVTAEGALGQGDPVLEAAVDALLERIQQ